jgi:hypothetical protein
MLSHVNKFFIFITFFIFCQSYASSQEKPNPFRKIAIHADYYLLLMRITEKGCEQYNKSKCSPEMMAHINRSLRKNMEESFNKQFTSKEIEYLDSLFKHPLMDRVYKFRREYQSNPEIHKLLQAEVKNFKSKPAKPEPKEKTKKPAKEKK